jgi:hypothetical protein
MAGQIEIKYYDDSIPLLPVSGNTPFGYYDNDPLFVSDAQKFVKYAARRLGYPIMEIELQDINFYAALEDATTTYGKELYEYKIRENYLTLEGSSTGSNLNNSLIQPNFANIIRIAKDYGSEVGSGGNINYYSGSIEMKANQQVYDLDAWASASLNLAPGDGIEVKRVFYEAPPAIIRYFDPYAGTGTGLQSLMETFGFGQFSPGINFMLMPVYFDVLKIQAIEFNDQIRKSAYSFELVNNKLRIFPIPTFDRPLFFTYIKLSERNSATRGNASNLVTNISNVPFNLPIYSQINAVFKKWVFDYAIAIVKETLGNIRATYQSIPVPGAEVTLNGQTLIDQANNEKTTLIEQLRGTLDDTSRQKQMEKRASEAEFLKNTLTNFPMPIYIA